MGSISIERGLGRCGSRGGVVGDDFPAAGRSGWLRAAGLAGAFDFAHRGGGSLADARRGFGASVVVVFNFGRADGDFPNLGNSQRSSWGEMVRRYALGGARRAGRQHRGDVFPAFRLVARAAGGGLRR